MRRFLCAFSLLILFFLSPLQAGGPNAVLPEGVVVKWDSSLPVRFLIDQGTLGFFPNKVGANMVRMGFQKWEDVGTGTIFSRMTDFFPRISPCPTTHPSWTKNGPTIRLFSTRTARLQTTSWVPEPGRW